MLVLSKQKFETKRTEEEGEEETEGSPSLKVSNLTCRWNGDAEAPVVKNINFEVVDNSLLLITGPVGCGKSSLLLAILNELPASEGTITKAGSIAYVPQTGKLWGFCLRFSSYPSLGLIYFGHIV